MHWGCVEEIQPKRLSYSDKRFLVRMIVEIERNPKG